MAETNDGAPRPDAAALAAQARAAAGAGDHAQARRLAEQMQASFPGLAEGWRIGLAAARALGDFDGGLAIAQRAQGPFPDAPWPLAQQASLSQQLGRIDEAAALAEGLRSRFPEHELGYAVGVGALRARERLAEALAVAEEGARRFPDRPSFAAQAGELPALIDNRARALALTARLAQAPPSLARPRVVVVLAMHRTGSSLVAQMLQKLGVGLGGPLMPANFANSDGYFEHLDIVAAHDAALRRMGVSWSTCWSALPQPPRLSPEAQAQTRARLEAVVERELEANGGLWGVKDPRLLRFLPLWDEIFQRLGVEPVWLLCLRDPRAVAGSLYARDRLPAEIGELLWIEHVAQALAQLGPRLSLLLPYERWFEAPQAQAEALARAVGREPGSVAAAARAEQRHQAPLADAAAALPLSMALHAALAAPAPDLVDLQGRAVALSRRLRRLAAEPASYTETR